MPTKYVLFLACYALMGILLFGNVQTTPALATPMATYMTHREGLKSKPSNLPAETVVIYITGSTNSCAQIILVRSTGAATYISCTNQKYETLPMSLTNTFFHDIHIALPLNALPPNRGCLKSISFGTRIYLTLNTQKSPDVSCSIDYLGHELYTDVKAIQTVLHSTILPPQQPV